MQTPGKNSRLAFDRTMRRRGVPNETYEYESERRRMRRLLTEFFDEWAKRHSNSETPS